MQESIAPYSQHFRPIALLDVENTLTCYDADRHLINIELLNELRARSIFDLYLLSDAVLLKPVVEDLTALSIDLAAFGFRLHAVVTPYDFGWAGYKPEEKKFDDANQAVMGGYTQLGIAFKDLQGAYQSVEDSADTTAIKECLDATRHLFNTAQLGKQTSPVKGGMLKMFLDYKPNWCSEIMIFEDQILEIEAIRAVAHKQQAIKTTLVHGAFDRVEPSLPIRNTFISSLRVIELDNVTMPVQYIEKYENNKLQLVLQSKKWAIKTHEKTYRELVQLMLRPDITVLSDALIEYHNKNLRMLALYVEQLNQNQKEVESLHSQFFPEIAHNKAIWSRWCELLQVINIGFKLPQQYASDFSILQARVATEPTTLVTEQSIGTLQRCYALWCDRRNPINKYAYEGLFDNIEKAVRCLVKMFEPAFERYKNTPKRWFSPVSKQADTIGQLIYKLIQLSEPERSSLSYLPYIKQIIHHPEFADDKVIPTSIAVCILDTIFQDDQLIQMINLARIYAAGHERIFNQYRYVLADNTLSVRHKPQQAGASQNAFYRCCRDYLRLVVDRFEQLLKVREKRSVDKYWLEDESAIRVKL